MEANVRQHPTVYLIRHAQAARALVTRDTKPTEQCVKKVS